MFYLFSGKNFVDIHVIQKTILSRKRPSVTVRTFHIFLQTIKILNMNTIVHLIRGLFIIGKIRPRNQEAIRMHHNRQHKARHHLIHHGHILTRIFILNNPARISIHMCLKKNRRSKVPRTVHGRLMLLTLQYPRSTLGEFHLVQLLLG